MSQIDRITEPDFLPNAQDIPPDTASTACLRYIDRITDSYFLLNAQDILKIRQILNVSDRQDH
jgi:hypothetical protein